MGHICLYIATLSAVLGAVGGIANSFLPVELMYWFVLAGAAFVVTFLIGWVASRFSRTTEGEND